MAEILVTYGRARLALRDAQLPQVVARLRTPPARGREHRVLADGSRDGARLGRVVERTLTPLPLDSRCLMQSLVLLGLLGRRGTSGDLVISVLPGESKLDAHAHVELDGRALLHPGTGDLGRLVTL